MFGGHARIADSTNSRLRRSRYDRRDPSDSLVPCPFCDAHLIRSLCSASGISRVHCGRDAACSPPAVLVVELCAGRVAWADQLQPLSLAGALLSQSTVSAGRRNRTRARDRLRFVLCCGAACFESAGEASEKPQKAGVGGASRSAWLGQSRAMTPGEKT